MPDSEPTALSGTGEQSNPAIDGAASASVQPRRDIAVVGQVVHRGPLPDPQSLGMYEEVLPGLADRIMKITESQVAHRHALDRRALQIVSRNTLLGWVSGGVIGLVGLLAGTYLLASGAGIEGFGVFISSLSALVGTFLYERRKAGRQSPE